MNQRPFSPITGQPFKVENYYFQIIFNRLIAKRPLTRGQVNYTFTVYKANQKCESTRSLPLHITQTAEYPLQGLRVNFVAINYNPSKNLTFEVRIVQNQFKKDKEVGEYVLDANHFIDQFNLSQNGAFTLRIDFNDDCAADIELYVQRSRYGVQRIIRDLKNPKTLAESSSRPPTHQKVTGLKKKIQIQPLLIQKEEQVHHSQKFTKFSPRRESNEANSKKDLFTKNQEEVKQAPTVNQQVPLPIIETTKEKKVKNTEFVPKKQWIIPEAEKYMKRNASKKESTKAQSNIEQKTLSSKDVKKKGDPVKKVQQKKVQQKQESNLFSYIHPKYLIIFAILSLLAFVSYQFLGSNPTPPLPQTAIKVEKTPKPKKQQTKSSKVKK